MGFSENDIDGGVKMDFETRDCLPGSLADICRPPRLSACRSAINCETILTLDKYV